MTVTWQLHAKWQDLLLWHLQFIMYTTGGLELRWDVSIVTIWFSNLVSGWLALHQVFGIALLIIFSLIIILLLLFTLLIVLLSSEFCMCDMLLRPCSCWVGSKLRWAEQKRAKLTEGEKLPLSSSLCVRWWRQISATFRCRLSHSHSVLFPPKMGFGFKYDTFKLKGGGYSLTGRPDKAGSRQENVEGLVTKANEI